MRFAIFPSIQVAVYFGANGAIANRRNSKTVSISKFWLTGDDQIAQA